MTIILIISLVVVISAYKEAGDKSKVIRKELLNELYK